MLKIWCCVSITERELFLSWLVGDSPSEQDTTTTTTTTTSLGPGQGNMLVDAVTSASFLWWRGQSPAWWLVIAADKSEGRWSILPQHYAFHSSIHFTTSLRGEGFPASKCRLASKWRPPGGSRSWRPEKNREDLTWETLRSLEKPWEYPEKPDPL